MTLQAVAIQTALDPSTPGFEAGSLLAGRYRLGEALGEGGMCLVFAAVDERLERDVAVKMLRPERSSPELVRRFVIEARTLAALDSPHLVEVLDLGAVQMPDGSRLPFMVLERLSGSDLRRFADERAPLPVSFIVTAVLQACEGVAAAHAAGIVHRDLKPENLFVRDDPSEGEFIKVLDFGIARLPPDGDANTSLTFEGEQMGSPGYTAPEQLCNARDVDPRTDIWSLGVVLYELLAGAPPFDGDTQREICANILMGRIVPLSKRNGALPSDLVTAVHRCLDSDRRRRFANIADLARAIHGYAGPDGLEYVQRIERRLGLPVTPEGRSGSGRDSVSRITPIPRGPASVAPMSEPANAAPMNEPLKVASFEEQGLDIPITVEEPEDDPIVTVDEVNVDETQDETARLPIGPVAFASPPEPERMPIGPVAFPSPPEPERVPIGPVNLGMDPTPRPIGPVDFANEPARMPIGPVDLAVERDAAADEAYVLVNEEPAPPPARPVRRFFAHALFVLLLVPALLLASIAIASRFPATAEWSERTAAELQQRATNLVERARTALFE